MMFIQDHATTIIPYRDLNFCNFIDTGTTLFSPTLVKLIDFCHSRYDYLPCPLQGKYNYTMRSEIQHSLSRIRVCNISNRPSQVSNTIKANKKKLGDLTQKFSLQFYNSLHSLEHSSLHSIRGLDVANLVGRFQSFHRFQTSEFPKTLYIFLIVQVYYQWHIRHTIL